MKKIDMQPTKSNILSMLEKDVIKRNEYIKNFIEMLDYIDENMSISLDGEWGTGKTFFVKQVIAVLFYNNNYLFEDEDEDEDKIELKGVISGAPFVKDIKLKRNYVPVYYNAWNNDSHSDPILSLIYHIAQENNLESKVKISKSRFEKIASVMDVINPWSSGSISTMLEKFQGDNTVIEIQGVENAKDILRELFDTILEERGDKIVVFIDELDRCNPRFAVQLLERIKHFFDDERIIFVFSTNLSQLRHTISNHYGSEFDSFRYLNKFFDVSFEMNEISIDDYINFVGFKRYGNYFDITAYELLKSNVVSMRDINRYVQLLDIVSEYINTNTNGFKEERSVQYILRIFVPILLLLKVIDLQKFMRIIGGTGYNILEDIVLKTTRVYRGLEKEMNIDENGEVTLEMFKLELNKIYDVLFNNKGGMEYESDRITINYDAKIHLMKVISLLKTGLTYK